MMVSGAQAAGRDKAVRTRPSGNGRDTLHHEGALKARGACKMSCRTEIPKK
jgi:hypothetical protein